MKKILSIGIDDSLSCTGIAIIKRNKGVDTLIDTSIIKAETKMDWTAAALRIAKICNESTMPKRLKYLKRGYEIRVAIELPFTWGLNSIVVERTGSVQKLYFLAGCIYNEFQGKCLLVQVNKWKGNSPKKITYQRMKEKYRFRFQANERNFNVSDAIGIADHALNKRTKADFVCPQFVTSVSRVG